MTLRHLFPSALAALLLSACSNEENSFDLSAQDTEQGGGQSVMLVDATGNPVCSLPSESGTYYLQVTSPAAWKLQSNDPYIVPLDTIGYGPKLVTVLVGENWNVQRTGSITLYEFECPAQQYNDQDYYNSVVVKKLASAKPEVTSIVQQEVSDLDRVRKCLSSNRGAGYSYTYGADFCMATGLEVFNMLKLEDIQSQNAFHLIEDDYYPQMMQSVYTADSKEELENEVHVEASIGIQLQKVSVSGRAEVGLGTAKDSLQQHAKMRVLGSYFTREINYLNCVALARQDKNMYEKLYSPGFRLVSDNFAARLASLSADELNDTTVVDPICQSFLNEVGPGFIAKSLMGCEMDYTMSMNRKAMNDTINIKGSLSITVSFAAGSISATAEARYKDKMKSIQNNSESSCTVRGGNVQLVSVLSSGGSVSDQTFHEWQLSVTPETAVMINMKIIPIYSVLVDQLSHDVLQEYIERKI